MILYPQCRVVFSAVFDGFGAPDSSPVQFTVIPRSAKVCKNNYKEADTFDVTFDGRQFPISPEQLRGAAVQIFMYDTKTLNAAPDPNLQPLLVGLVDHAHLKGDDKGLELKISGRDYTGLLIDRQWDPRRRVPIGKPLDQLVGELAHEVTKGVGAGKDLKIQFIGEPGEAPTAVGTIHNKKTKKRGFQVAQGGKNYWDVIYNLCVRHGFIVFVDGETIVISKPRVLMNASKDQLVQMVYGKNLSSIEVQRKLGKETVPQIIVRSYDPATQKVLEAKYPEVVKIGDVATTGIGTKKNEQRSFVLPGITDLAALKRAAQNAYHQLARGEGRIRFSTKFFTDVNGKTLFGLKAGMPISIGFEPFIPDAVFIRLTEQERISKLLNLGYNRPVATLIAQSFEKLDYFRRPFYVMEASYGFDKDTGITIDCEAMNYIVETRALKLAGETISSGVKAVAGAVTKVFRGF